MPDTDENLMNGVINSSNSSSNYEPSTSVAPVTGEIERQDADCTTSRRQSGSDIPCPFDSQSSLDEENGNGRKDLFSNCDHALRVWPARRKSLRARIEDFLGVYPNGYESGRINQIVRSRK